MPRSRPSRATPEALEALRERLEATRRAAQDLADEAAGSRPPASGWDVPRSAEQANDELDALVRLVASLGELLPPELRAQLAELVRQLLVFVRAVLDWWIGRLEREDGDDGEDTGVEDIPIA
jgi:hypothetical protein